jgi:hypothetical protein
VNVPLSLLLFYLRTLLPELLTFAYIPADHLKFNGTNQPDPPKDIFSDFAGRTQTTQYDEGDRVLVLEMDDRMVRKKSITESQVSLVIELVL